MPRLLLLELAIFLSPFVAYGLYQMALRDAAAEGRKAWPITALFGAGLSLAVIAWLFLIFGEDRDRNVCRSPESFNVETQEIIPAREYPCDADIESIGQPRVLEVPIDDPSAGETAPDNSL
ncbi:MAG: DUF6111 family protein [Pseudomonadota bacterium]